MNERCDGPVHGVIFDKDGTLFDFQTSWGRWADAFLSDLSSGDTALKAVLAKVIMLDLETLRFDPKSFVIAGTPDEIAAELSPHLPANLQGQDLVARMNEAAASAEMVEAVPLAPFLQQLRAQGLRLGVATNDAEGPARAHLAASGVEQAFDFIVGFDSGFGGKPAPGQLIGFSKAMGLAPETIAMVGDSTHDLIAGRSAGMKTVGVLTGTALAADLEPFADVILPDIGHLPKWLGIGAQS